MTYSEGNTGMHHHSLAPDVELDQLAAEARKRFGSLVASDINPLAT